MQGDPIFYIVKYIIDGKKVFSPWTWDGTTWNKKALKNDRPIYGLELLNSRPILIVEGEKTANDLRKLSKHYTVVSWPGGSKAVDKTDWKPLENRDVLIWPDCDKAGMDAAEKIAFKLYGKTKSLKILRVTDRPSGWDASDAIEMGWNWEYIIDWAKPLAEIYEPPVKRVSDISDDDPAGTVSLLDNHECESLWEYIGLARMKNGNVHCNSQNIVRIFERVIDFKNFVWYDEFHAKIFTKDNNKVREWNDDDDIRMMMLFQDKLGMVKISEKQISQAVRFMAKKDVRNEPKEALSRSL